MEKELKYNPPTRDRWFKINGWETKRPGWSFNIKQNQSQNKMSIRKTSSTSLQTETVTDIKLHTYR